MAAPGVQLIPSPEEIMQILKRTGAFREGHFVYPNGKHTAHYFQMPLAFRYYDTARVLAVALSRKFRVDRDIASQLPKVSIISPSSGGIPVAFGVRDALSAQQIYWAEQEGGTLFAAATLSKRRSNWSGASARPSSAAARSCTSLRRRMRSAACPSDHWSSLTRSFTTQRPSAWIARQARRRSTSDSDSLLFCCFRLSLGKPVHDECDVIGIVLWGIQLRSGDACRL